MNTIKEKIMRANFKKLIGRWAIAAIVILVATVVTGGFLLHRYEVEEESTKGFSTEISGNAQIGDENAQGDWQDEDNMQSEDRHDEHDGDEHDRDDKDDEEDAAHGEHGHQDGEQEGEHEDEHDEGEWLDAMERISLSGKIALGILFLLCCLTGIALWILIAAWLYQSAELAQMNATLWGVMGIIGSIVAALVFIIIRSFRACCPICGRRQKSAAFCRFCGASMNEKCKERGLNIPKDSAFCPHCGKAQKE